MDTTPHTTGNAPGHTDEYLGMEEGDTRVVAKSLKIPAHLARELDHEVADAGMSFNAYVQNILLNRHQGTPANAEELELLREALTGKDAKILELREDLHRVRDESIQKGFDHNKMLNRISDLELEVSEYASSEEEWEKRNILLQAKLDALTAGGSPTARKSDVVEAKALRRIITEHTFLTNPDIDQLLHEDSDY